MSQGAGAEVVRKMRTTSWQRGWLSASGQSSGERGGDGQGLVGGLGREEVGREALTHRSGHLFGRSLNPLNVGFHLHKIIMIVSTSECCPGDSDIVHDD